MLTKETPKTDALETDLPNSGRSIENLLDRIEDNLPLVPRAWLRLNRAVAHAGCSLVSTVSDEVSRRGRQVADVTRVGGRTVAGQATAQGEAVRSEVADVVEAVGRGAKTVIGQARAEAGQARDAVTTATVGLLDEATEQVESAEDNLPSTDDLDLLTKAELYAVAQDLDIDGRSGMDKDELAAAIRSDRARSGR